MTRCEQPGCPGFIDETGFCTECGLRPLASGPTRPAIAEVADREPSADSIQPVIGFAELPLVEENAPESQVMTDAQVPETHRYCGVCRRPVGRSRIDQPAVPSGFCPRCGTRFSFEPRLRRGDLLGQYEVVDPLAHGGVGWVYLARDRHLDGRYVALKGLINENDPKTAEAAVNERKHLIALDHENIVRILDFVIDRGTDKPTGYIVMEYVGGKSLQQIKNLSRSEVRPLPVEDVVKYGLQLLDALGYLHARDLVYCDLKPDNVIHQRHRVKLIDLGAMCERGFTGDVWVTDGYTVSPQERKTRGMQPDMDLYSAGKTLRSLLVHSREGGPLAAGTPVKPGIESLVLALDRATEDDWRRRFTSAAEMSEQLDGILRQLAALRGIALPPKPSAKFAAGLELLDDGLGAAPPLERWSRADADVLRPETLAHGRPAPAAVALTLPSTLIDLNDPAAGFLAAVTTEDPDRLLGELANFGKPSAEVEFARCRAYLALGDNANAEKALIAARLRIGDDWRTYWHSGLLALHGQLLDDAKAAFTEVWRILPGELVPRLALGYCGEHLDAPDSVVEHYDVVWHTDQAEVSAAFGLARAALAKSDREGAVRALDAVRPVSKFYDAARTAAIRVCAERIGPDGEPDAASVAQAVGRLAVSTEDGPGHARLVAVVRQAALALLQRSKSPDLPSGDVLGSPVTEHGVRVRLEHSFRELAGQAGNDDDHGTLIDLANTVRPRTRW